ncbi:MAG: hypothetical protein RI885_1130, partial [Actinomycetota bacterium]
MPRILYHALMPEEWPLLGPAHIIRGFIEPMEWGRSTYTVLR